MRKCPIHIEIRVQIKLWPIGSYVISGVSARYIENYEQKQVFPAGAAVNGSFDAFIPIATNTVPSGNPTTTPTPNPSFTPTLQNTPNNCFIYGVSASVAGLSCFPDPPVPPFPEECVIPCTNNQNAIIGYNCNSICGAQ